MKDAFKGFDHGTGVIDLSVHGSKIKEARPIEIHLKKDGDIHNLPSLAIVMRCNDNSLVFGQISLEMLNAGLEDIGYEIKKIDEFPDKPGEDN